MRSPTFIVKAWNAILNREQNVRASFNALKIIETEHERIHAGKSWAQKDEHVLPPLSTGYYAVKVNSDFSGQIHLRNLGFTANNGPIKLHFYEDTFINVNSLGTELPLRNLNRNYSDNCDARLYAGTYVNVNSLGTHLDFIFEPAAAPGNQPAGSDVSNALLEWVLDKDKWYAIQMQNTHATNSATLESQFMVYDAI